MARLKYVLSNGCKENLVASPLEWPGVHCVRALLLGELVEGTWQNRTLARSFQLRGKPASPGGFETRETVILSQLSCWKYLSPEVYRARLAELVRRSRRPPPRRERRKGSSLWASSRSARRARDATRDSRQVTRAVHPRGDQESAEDALRSLCRVRGRLPGSRGQAQERRSERRLPSWQLPAAPAIRAGLSPFASLAGSQKDPSGPAMDWSLVDVCSLGRSGWSLGALWAERSALKQENRPAGGGWARR